MLSLSWLVQFELMKKSAKELYKHAPDVVSKNWSVKNPNYYIHPFFIYLAGKTIFLDCQSK
jgi:hypothetical protein